MCLCFLCTSTLFAWAGKDPHQCAGQKGTIKSVVSQAFKSEGGTPIKSLHKPLNPGAHHPNILACKEWFFRLKRQSRDFRSRPYAARGFWPQWWCNEGKNQEVKLERCKIVSTFPLLSSLNFPCFFMITFSLSQFFLWGDGRQRRFGSCVNGFCLHFSVLLTFPLCFCPCRPWHGGGVSFQEHVS